MDRQITITPKTVVNIILIGLAFWTLFLIKDILVMLFISLILMAAMGPYVDWLENKKIPRGIGVLIVNLILWGCLSVVFASIIPDLISQTTKLIRLLPSAVSQIEILRSYEDQITDQLLIRLGAVPEYLLKFSVGIFGNILDVFTTVVLTVYLLLERKNLHKYMIHFVGHDKVNKTIKTIDEIESRLGGWVRGELALMFTVGLATYIGLSVLGVEIALPLAVIAGLLELIPNIGPTISAIPAILIAAGTSMPLAILTAILYLAIQQLENHFLVPKIMQKAAGVNPLISILALMIGFRIYGPMGAVLSIPVLISIQTIKDNIDTKA